MSVLTMAAGSKQRKSGGPAQFHALRPPVFDDVRTYQLIARDSDDCPHALSAVGTHPGILDALNLRRRLTHEIASLKDDATSAADARRVEIKAALDALLKVSLERTDFAASMLMLYADAEADAIESEQQAA